MATGTPVLIGFYPSSQSPVDERYLKEGEPYADEADVLASIPLGSRNKYLIVNIAGVLYWFLADLTTLEPVTLASVQTASETDITDAGDYYTSTEVEGALQEVGAELELINAALAPTKTNPYTIYLNASSDVATRLSGLIEGTDYPTGWTLAADSAVNLLITHTLTGRKLASVNIFETDGSNERLAKPFSDAYSGVLNGATTVLIEGLDTLAVDLRIELIFN